MDSYKIAIIGASGLVGQELTALFESQPSCNLRLFASKTRENFLQPTLDLLKECDLAIFCADKETSQRFIPSLKALGIPSIDMSSAYRLSPDVPLVIPEINGSLLEDSPLTIASPNCTTTLLLMALFPLHQLFHLSKVTASTYQAMSGGGSAALESLYTMCRDPDKLNLWPHESPLLANGYVEEEMKLLYESRKIMNLPELEVTSTCVRVPIKRAHSIAASVQFKKPFCLDKARNALSQMEGLTYIESEPLTPLKASGAHPVFCGRLRCDLFDPKSCSLWITGDQLLKGAALNAFQIVKILFKNFSTIV